MTLTNTKTVSMGIPAVKYPNPTPPPEGYSVTDDDRELRDSDLIWDTQTCMWIEKPDWVSTTRTKTFYGVAEKDDADVQV
jgi:hypothetical protein